MYLVTESGDLQRHGQFTATTRYRCIDVNSGQQGQDRKLGASLVVQWLGIGLVIQGTPVQSLVLEDPTYCMETKAVLHNC